MSKLVYPRMKRKDKLSAILSDKDIIEIKKLRKKGLTLSAIGDLYGAHHSTIRLVISKKARITHRKIVNKNTKRRMKNKAHKKEVYEKHNKYIIASKWANPTLREYLRIKSSIYNKLRKNRGKQK